MSEDEKGVIHSDPTVQRGFTAVPNVVLDSYHISLPARMLFIYLKQYAWQQESAFPGQTRLGEALGMGERQVRVYLTELIDAGWVTRERRGLGLTNRYWLNEPTPRDEDSHRTDQTPTPGLIGSGNPIHLGSHDPSKKTQEEKKTQNKNTWSPEEVNGRSDNPEPVSDEPGPSSAFYRTHEAERARRHAERDLTDEERQQALEQWHEFRRMVEGSQ